MKSILILSLLFTSFLSFSQIKSGEYNSGLKLIQVNDTCIKGYFESYTGNIEGTNTPKFSCIFFMDAKAKSSNSYLINSYYPFDNDTIKGELIVIDSNKIKIKLNEEHGGCWNVLHFADDFEIFTLENSFNAIDLNFIKTDKCYFFQKPDLTTKRKAYIVKGQFFVIEKKIDDWVFGTYYGNKVTKGWIKRTDIE